MFSGLRNRLERRALEAVFIKVNAARERKFIPLKQVKSIAMLYKLRSENLPTELYSFISRFETAGVNVDLIIVDRRKQLPSDLDAKDNFYHIGHEEISWYGIPKSDKILGILQKNHDYFIDLTMEQKGLCAYLSAASMAKFKIGGVLYQNAPFDLTIDVNSETDLGFFAEQLITYLKKIG